MLILRGKCEAVDNLKLVTVEEFTPQKLAGKHLPSAPQS